MHLTESRAFTSSALAAGRRAWTSTTGRCGTITSLAAIKAGAIVVCDCGWGGPLLMLRNVAMFTHIHTHAYLYFCEDYNPDHDITNTSLPSGPHCVSHTHTQPVMTMAEGEPEINSNRSEASGLTWWSQEELRPFVAPDWPRSDYFFTTLLAILPLSTHHYTSTIIAPPVFIWLPPSCYFFH